MRWARGRGIACPQKICSHARHKTRNNSSSIVITGGQDPSTAPPMSAPESEPKSPLKRARMTAGKQLQVFPSTVVNFDRGVDNANDCGDAADHFKAGYCEVGQSGIVQGSCAITSSTYVAPPKPALLPEVGILDSRTQQGK